MMIASVRDDSWQNMQLGAGVLLRNADFSRVKTAAAMREAVADAMMRDDCIIGATKDGGTFTCRPMLRSTEGDARRTAAASAVVNDGWTVRMTGTLMEITPGSFAMTVGPASAEKNGAATEICTQGDVQEGFLHHLCWVGDTSRGFLLIEMHGVMSTGGAVLRMHEDGSGEMPFDLQAHVMGADNGAAPCRIVFLEEDE